MPVKNIRGFSLIEVLVGLGVFMLFAVGIYSSVHLIFRVVYESRLRILETAIANEQIEIIRNLPYEDVGIVSSTPSGIFTKTSVISRNNLSFLVTRVIRNVDDAYDGTIGGTPDDTDPADYKFVEITVTCQSCQQESVVSLSTNVVSSGGEENLYTGALVVSVFDAAALPVSGASVHIVATSTSSSIDMYDTTNASGKLQVLGLSPGNKAYHVTITKSGFTSDGTIIPSAGNPNPTQQPLSIEAGKVTSVNFFIDNVSGLTVNTLDTLCDAVQSVPLTITGSSFIGTNPNVYAVDSLIQTNTSGEYVSNTIHWDAYNIISSDYDIAGAVPPLPISIAPRDEKSVSLVLSDKTVNSLLLYVRDSITGQPLSDAAVTVTSTNYFETGITPNINENSLACTPPGQVFFADMSSATTTVTIDHVGYQTVIESIPISGSVYTIIDMVPSG